MQAPVVPLLYHGIVFDMAILSTQIEDDVKVFTFVGGCNATSGPMRSYSNLQNATGPHHDYTELLLLPFLANFH